MFLNKTYTPSKSLQFLWLSKLNYSLLLILMALSFPVFAQEGEEVLPESFYGNWVEDLSECEAGSYFSIADSEIGLFVFGLGWSSTEVKVENTGEYYTLFVDAVSEGGDFQSEIKIKMGEDGNLFFIDSGSEEKELVKCDSTEFFEFESEEMTLGDEGLELEELGMVGTMDLEAVELYLPSAFYGYWVEDFAQCEVAPILNIVDSEEGLTVSSIDWSSNEVKVMFKDGIYTLFIKGVSEEGDFETEMFIKMDEEGNIWVGFSEAELENKLIKCELIEIEEPIEMEMMDSELEVEEFDIADTLSLENINVELLQGKWQSLEDEASFMVIEGDRMKNYYGGMDEELDNEMIMISETCMNEADSANGLAEEKNRYLSNPNLDMCWYIEYVDSTSLSLIYMATGNTLTYRRVE
jgi:hypothetical protein